MSKQCSRRARKALLSPFAVAVLHSRSFQSHRPICLMILASSLRYSVCDCADLQRSSPDRKPSSQADRHDSAPQAAAASPLLTPEPSGGSLNGTQHPAEGLRPDSTPGTQGSSGLPHKGPSRLGDDPVKAVNVGEEAGDAADRQTEQPKKDWVSPFASSTLQTDRPWRKPESNPATSTTHSRTHSGTSAVEPPVSPHNFAVA